MPVAARIPVQSPLDLFLLGLGAGPQHRGARGRAGLKLVVAAVGDLRLTNDRAARLRYHNDAVSFLSADVLLKEKDTH